MIAPQEGVALDAAGARVPERTVTLQAQVEEKVDLAVERWGPAAGQSGPLTVFLVAVPESTPREDTVWLAGNQPELGGWAPSGVKLFRAVDNHYATSLAFAPGTSLEFKVTRGEWTKVENSAQGKSISNRTFKTGGGFERVPLSVANWEDLYKAPVEHTTTGNIEYLHDVASAYATQAKREVIVWLPPGYELPANSARRYPVLYMHDGQNLMDVATSYAGEWKVDETARELIEAGRVEPLIIVGVANAGTERLAEYTHTSTDKYPEGGRADLYGDFLVNELKPFIDGTYLTRPEGDSTGLAGSSLGGLVSLYLGMQYPDTFTRLGVVSPSVWWDAREILGRVAALDAPLPLRVWVDIGTDEGTGEEAETVRDAEALHQALLDKGWAADGVHYKVYDGAQHNEAAWSQRFGEVLEFLYPPVP